jgi:hypothetical protein
MSFCPEERATDSLSQLDTSFPAPRFSHPSQGEVKAHVSMNARSRSVCFNASYQMPMC